ncbi:hemolysin [Bacillus phage vB_BpsS-140]|nr:hemolysin [Bacillus phage vB_BpsS-140]
MLSFSFYMGRVLVPREGLMEPIRKDMDTIRIESDIKSLNKDVELLKANQERHIDDIRALQNSTTIHGQQIATINKTLDGIADDTRWIKRAIIGAIITSIIGATIGGVITAFNIIMGG